MEKQHAEDKIHRLDAEKPYKRKTAFFILTFGWVAILLAIVGSIRFGASDINTAIIWESIFHFDGADSAQVIIHDLRIPRALAALFVGASLAVSGAVMQGMTRNPLGDPSILGVTAGALFAMSLALAFFPGSNYPNLIFVSFLGAGLGTALVFSTISISKGGNIAVKMALAGSAITSLLIALSTAVGLRFDISKDMSYWYAGGVSSIQFGQLKYVIPAMIAGICLAIFISRSITILSLGEEVAKGLGQNTKFVYVAGIITVLLLTGAAVSIAGMIGFIGLVIPHITRFLVGVDYRLIIPCSAVLGALLMVGADVISRMVNPPFETPVGAVTAIVGVPFFLYLARKERSTL
ncbi:FecCD family ABC transporter permease [Virgibacillus halophilus]|uniref:FecCD family ABC transporter permease n=1 Tax=Tigheibacillus halophilus TaxID=361280 RepID=UPI003631810F